ncbi:MAG: RyR domain-containing protein [Devosia sp.]
MNRLRLLFYVVVLVGLAVAGYLLLLWALFACAPPPLPGDELWTWRHNASAALALALRAGSTTCFTGDTAAAFGLWLGARTAGVVLVALAAIVLWETAGRHLRRLAYRSRGGHVLLAGEPADIAGLRKKTGGPAVYLAAEPQGLRQLSWAHPFAEAAPIEQRTLPALLQRFGASRARFIAATTRDDLANIAIADSVLATPGNGEVLLRLEQAAVRALSAHRLRGSAAASGRSLAVVSLTQLQTRRGMMMAMSGRYSIDGDPRVHIVICGNGPALQAVAVEVLRQGFGLERQRPLLSIIRTGTWDVSASLLERLHAGETAELQTGTAEAGVAGGLDRAIAALTDGPPLRVVHCTGATPAEAEAIALRAEELLLALGLPVPPIVAYGSSDRPLGSTGMIRVAEAPDLSEARDLAHLMDARARAVHELFMSAQRAERKGAFGTAPAEVEWARLPEPFRDDNRAVADHMDLKLAETFMLARPGGTAAALTSDEIEQLAGLAHARWWAAKALSGWRYGARRDDRTQLHPDMISYAALDEPTKQKDRDEVASLPAMAALAGETLAREWRLALLAAPGVRTLSTLLQNLGTAPKDSVPVIVVALNEPAMIEAASALLANGIRVEAVLDAATDRNAAGLADVLRRAWRVHVALGRSALEAVRQRAPLAVDETGAIDALA